MYLTNSGGYCDSDGTQHARKGLFLMLASGQDDIVQHGEKGYKRVYACVRMVALSQLGHWMMGTARIGGHSVTCSGAYGHDGLTMDLDRLHPDVRKRFTPLSDEDTIAYWTGEGGWNSAGSEAEYMRQVGLRIAREEGRL